MITCIIPSLNRASQLDLLINSLHQNWQSNQLDIHVICKATDVDYIKGYNILSEYLYGSNFNSLWMHKEEDFCYQIKDIVKNSNNSIVGFFTDDCVMFQSPLAGVGEIEKIISSCRDIYLSFSLRLGANTIIQNYLTGELQPKLDYKDMGNNIIEWNWKRYPPNTNWGYIYSWDGHFYHKDYLISCFEHCHTWENPRAFEHQMVTSQSVRNMSPNKMLACKHSSVFVNTINAVQDNCIPAGVKHSYSPKQLNDRFLSGERISLESFAHQRVISCHEEFPLIWEKS